MADYISREALYKEVTEKYRDIVAGPYPYNIVAHDMARLVEEAPAADVVSRETHEAVQKALIAFAETDVVPVVRCIHCKEAVIRSSKELVYCRLWGDLMENNEFCSKGERKADNGREEI